MCERCTYDSSATDPFVFDCFLSNNYRSVISEYEYDALGNETLYEYDKYGNVVKEMNTDGSYVKFEYDEYGYVIKKSVYAKTDKVGYITTYKYDDDYNLLKSVDCNGSGVAFRYTIYEYDKFGRNTGYAEINTSTEPSQEQIDESKTRYVYNAQDQLVKMYYPANVTGKLKGVKFTYNKDKWLVKISGLIGDEEKVSTIREYVYYNDGKIKEMHDYSNFLEGTEEYIVRAYEYDVHDRVTSMKYYSGEMPEVLLEHYKYKFDNNSRITYEYEYLNYESCKREQECEYTYNKVGRLSKSRRVDLSTQIITTVSYVYDKNGNRTIDSEIKGYTDSKPPSHAHSYFYVFEERKSARSSRFICV